MAQSNNQSLVEMPSTTQNENLAYLSTIKSVRETNLCTKKLLLQNKLQNFDVNLDKLDQVIEFVSSTIRGSFPTNESLLTIPVHGRYQHFECNGVPRLTKLIETAFAGVPDLEICRKLVDLFIVSVLLDAGAGNVWAFEEDGVKIGRSEGIAVASFHMFVAGQFSRDPETDKYQVNGAKLATFTAEDLSHGFQVTEENPLAGFDGRLKLIKKLGQTLTENTEIFGKTGRPGNLVDYLISKSTASQNGGYKVELEDLWACLMDGLTPIWPTEGRIQVYGQTIGDAWYLKNKIQEAEAEYGTADVPEWTKVVTFHKLTQWLTYSLFLPLSKYGGFEILNAHYMTGLPEYRNGGLFVDFGVLSLKSDVLQKGLEFSKTVGYNPDIPTYTPEDDAIVEWRSCIICLLDYILPLVNSHLKVSDSKFELTLPQLIEAGSWKSGRLIAKKLRDNGGPPIELFADGTVF